MTICRVWLAPDAAGGWTQQLCEYPIGHDGLHADNSMFPCVTDEDIQFFKDQHDLIYGDKSDD